MENNTETNKGQSQSVISEDKNVRYIYAVTQNDELVSWIKYLAYDEDKKTGEVKERLDILNSAIERQQFECAIRGYSFDELKLIISDKPLEYKGVSSYGNSFKFTISQIVCLPKEVKSKFLYIEEPPAKQEQKSED